MKLLTRAQSKSYKPKLKTKEVALDDETSVLVREMTAGERDKFSAFVAARGDVADDDGAIEIHLEVIRICTADATGQRLFDSTAEVAEFIAALPSSNSIALRDAVWTVNGMGTSQAEEARADFSEGRGESSSSA